MRFFKSETRKSFFCHSGESRNLFPRIYQIPFSNGMTFLVVLLSLFLLTGCFSKTQAPAPYTHYGLNGGGADSGGVHTVSEGDTLWDISQRYEMNMQDVIYENKLRPPYVLAVGQRLNLPPPQTYKVRAGDSLYTISRTFNTSQTQIARQNKLKPPYIIQPGQKLKLPSVSRSYSGAPVKTARGTAKPSSKPSRKLASKVPDKTPARAGSKFMWPANGPVISSYGPKKGGLHNDGINIKAARGTSVAAAENGTVVYAGSDLDGFGNLVLVRHADRWMTAYAHLDKVSVKKGQTVKQGHKIGAVGSTGGVDAPQLHFEIRRGTKALNPTKYLGSQKS